MTASITPPPGLAPLLERPNWVCWRREQRGGKTTKVPYQPRGGKAKAGEPATWSPFAEVATAQATGRFDGIGYEFHAGQGIFDVDLDNVRDPQTGKLAPLATAAVALCGTYAEPSPSGRGVHIIGLGELPRPEIAEGRQGKKKGQYELYGGDRYFTMTLQPFPGYDEVREVDAAAMRRLVALLWPEDAAPKPQPAPPRPRSTVDTPPPCTLDDAALLDRAFAAGGGEDLRRRHLGDHLLDDPSGDDWAYFRALAFWAQRDPARVQRLAEGSGRVRDKWFSRRGSQTWLEYSVEKACREQTDSYDPQAHTLRGRGDNREEQSERTAAARLAELERENATLAVALERCGAESARKDARIADLEWRCGRSKPASATPTRRSAAACRISPRRCSKRTARAGC